MILVDDAPLSIFPYKDDWVAIEMPDDQHVAFVVPDIHLELTYSTENYGFTLSIPSHLFSNQTEGLCGKFSLRFSIQGHGVQLASCIVTNIHNSIIKAIHRAGKSSITCNDKCENM